MQELQFIECVAERDIDLLLLEEYHVSASFRSWLIGQAFEPDFCCGQFLGARHSVNQLRPRHSGVGRQRWAQHRQLASKQLQLHVRPRRRLCHVEPS